MPKPDATYIPEPSPTKAEPHLPHIPGYRLVKLLGQGGMGQVYEAVDTKLHRTVALKLVSSTQENVLARFQQEVQAIASLRHPHITQIYESGVVEGRPWFAMELVRGGSLADHLRSGPLPHRTAAELLRTLALAMHYAHDQQILHRDLKPGNILLEGDKESNWSPRISDFGLAKKLSDASKLTQTGEVFGSPSYMAPEQASGIGKLTPAVDVYALGAILYECISGRPPFLGSDPIATVMMVLSQEPISLRRLQVKLSADFNTICMKCLQKSPKKRYTSAKELADDLDRFLENKPIQARPVSTLERAMKWSIRNPWKATAAVLACCMVVSLAVGAWMLRQAYLQTRTANEKTNKALDLSLDVFGTNFEDITAELSQFPKTEPQIEKAQKNIVEMYRSLDALRPDDLRTTLKYTSALYNYSLSQALYRKFGPAKEALTELEKVLDRKRLASPDNVELKLDQIKFLLNKAWIYKQTSESAQARKDEVTASKLIEEVRKVRPNDAGLLHQRNTILEVEIGELLAQGKREEVFAAKKELIANLDTICKQDPSLHNKQIRFAQRRSYANLLHVSGKISEARQELVEIAESLPSLKVDPQNNSYSLVFIHTLLGDIERQSKNFVDSKKHFDQALPLIQKLRHDYPDYINYLYNEFDLQGKTQQLRYDEGKQAEAISALETMLEEMRKTIARHPEYETIASLRTYYQKILEKYKTPQEK